MSFRGLNLARRPFVNSRPVTRLALVAWVVGGALFLVNLALFWTYYSGSGDVRTELTGVVGRIAGERGRLQQLEADLEGRDLASQNGRAAFLNSIIAARTFAWSELFDRLAEVLPVEVRLFRLSPGLAGESSRAGTTLSAGQVWEGAIELDLEGDARSGDDLLRFLDALFAHPSFRSPRLSRERQESGSLVRFVLTVLYFPGAPAAEGGAGGAEVADAG